MAFGDKLKEIRLDRGLSQERFADILGTSKQMIYLYETGQRIPKITTLQDYANKLHMPVSYFLDSESKESQVLAHGGVLSKDAIEQILSSHDEIELRELKNEIIVALAKKQLTKEQLCAIKAILESM